VRKTKVRTRVIHVVHHMVGSSNTARDRMYRAMLPGMRRTAHGTTYYETRRNRSDIRRKKR
jgi:hypothetical protein